MEKLLGFHCCSFLLSFKFPPLFSWSCHQVVSHHTSPSSQKQFLIQNFEQKRREGGVWCFCLNLIITAQKRERGKRNPSNFSSSSLLELNWLVSPSDSCREDDDGQILKMCLPFFPLLCLSIIFPCLLSVFSLSLQDHSWQTSLDWVQVKHLTWIPLGQGLYQVFQEELEVESLARRRKNEDTGIYTFLIPSFCSLSRWRKVHTLSFTYQWLFVNVTHLWYLSLVSFQLT